MLFYNYDPVAQVYFLCGANGKLLSTPDEGSNKYFICDGNGVFDSLGLIPEGLAGRYSVSEVIRNDTDDGWSFVLDGETISYDGSELSVTVSEFEGAIPVIGVVQIFAEAGCTRYASGSRSILYARVNSDVGNGFNSSAGDNVLNITKINDTYEVGYTNMDYPASNWMADGLLSIEAGQVIALETEDGTPQTGIDGIIFGS